MCGFGPRTGARTLAEIGDPHRFANPARLAAYAGLAPVNRQSGRTSNTRPQHEAATRTASNAMFIAAFVATNDPDTRAYSCANEPKAKNTTAVICVARRRPNIILAMPKPKLPTNHPGNPRKPTPAA